MSHTIFVAFINQKDMHAPKLEIFVFDVIFIFVTFWFKNVLYNLIYVSGDKDRYSFPTDISTLHAEFTYFYFPGDFEFPCKFKLKFKR